MAQLRNFQTVIVNGCYDAWNKGAKKVMPVSPTGSGKTVMVGEIVKTVNEPATSIAHRAELVGQISLAQAQEGIRHRVIGPPKLQSMISRMHIKKLGADYVNPHSKFAVAGVDTLVRLSPSDPIFSSTRMWVIDEAHHVLKANKWGRAAAMFRPDCWGLMPTATPMRADGKGLGALSDGLVDEMVVGPGMRDLINQGYLCDYRVICPKSNLDRAAIHITAGGELDQKEMAREVKKSSVTGDVVNTYLQRARGMLGVVFAADIEHAGQIAQGLRAAGVTSEVVTGETPPDLRADILAKFAAREIMVLVNVDLFGEGFDLPALEVVIFARPTESFSLYAQQFGRALRLMISKILSGAWHTYSDQQRRQFIAESVKSFALVIDHVGNILRHGLPDKPRVYSLDRRASRSTGPDDGIPLRVCQACTGPYERVYKACPYCGHTNMLAERSSIAHVDGVMEELPLHILQAMRGEVLKIDNRPDTPAGLTEIAARGFQNRHYEKQQAQRVLRDQISLWAGGRKHAGYKDDEIQRLFYFIFKIDILSAQALNRADAEMLTSRIVEKLQIDGFVRMEYATH